MAEKFYKIRPSVVHLMRGQIFEIGGKSIFTFGGASSHDIDGGILDLDDPDYKNKKKRLDRGWKPYRLNHASWWLAGASSHRRDGRGTIKESDST